MVKKKTIWGDKIISNPLGTQVIFLVVFALIGFTSWFFKACWYISVIKKKMVGSYVGFVDSVSTLGSFAPH